MTFALVLLQATLLAPGAAQFTLPSGVKVKIEEATFSPGRARIEKGPRGGLLIDGKIPFGVLLELPKTYVKSITIEYRGRTRSLDVSGMYDAWNQRPLSDGPVRYFGGRCDDDSGQCVVRGVFSDGMASFVAEWVVADGVSQRTVITASGDVVNLFLNHIDPPSYD